MKRVLIVTILSLIFFTSLFADYNGSTLTNSKELDIVKIDSYDLIQLPSSMFTEEIGAPRLPVIIQSFVIPNDVDISNIVVTSFK